MEERTVVDPGFGYAAGSEATVVVGAPVAGGFDVTQQAIVTTCPVCSATNPPGNRFCQDCGYVAGSIASDEVPELGESAKLVDASGREHSIDQGANSVGRESADVLLPDPTVSRRHAVLTVDGTQVLIEDLGSTNGTQISGRRLVPNEKSAAFHGDRVSFGKVELTLHLPGAPARPASLPAPGQTAGPAAQEPAVDRGPVLAEVTLPDGSVHSLYAGVNTVGRRSTNQIVLPDAFASGAHAEFHVSADGTVEIVDIGSTNGSFYAGERLAHGTRITLTPGDSVTLGKTLVALNASLESRAEPETMVVVEAGSAEDEAARP